MPYIYRIIFLLITTSTFLPLKAQKITPELQAELEKNLQADCIVFFGSPDFRPSLPSSATKAEKAVFCYQTLVKYLDSKSSGIVDKLKKEHLAYQMNYVSGSIIILKANINLVNEIALSPLVKKIYNNATFRINDKIESVQLETRSAETTWGLLITQTDSVHRMNITGQGTVIGGNDTGFDWTHPALRSKYRGWNAGTVDHNYNWHDGWHQISPLSDSTVPNPCGVNLKYPCDDNSHGTHTMGTMLGSIPDSLTIGMAPEAKWIATRNMERGNGSLASYLECFNWHLAPTDTNDLNPDPLKAADVINNSWYCSTAEGCNPSNWDILLTAVANLTQAGIVVVISAGNDGPGCETIRWAPNISEQGFSVGAIAPNDTIAGFSSRGLVSIDSSGRMKPDVTAPGVYVLSSVPGNRYAYYSGTSMAGPHVAGLVALLISANPQLKGQVDTICDIIRKSSLPKFTDQDCSGIDGMDYPNPVYGYGRINALAAVEEAMSWNPTSKVRKTFLSSANFFPNPATDAVNLYINDGNAGIVSLVDLGGKLILSREIQPTEKLVSIDVSKIIPGIYIIRHWNGINMNIAKLEIVR